MTIFTIGSAEFIIRDVIINGQLLQFLAPRNPTREGKILGDTENEAKRVLIEDVHSPPATRVLTVDARSLDMISDSSDYEEESDEGGQMTREITYSATLNEDMEEDKQLEDAKSPFKSNVTPCTTFRETQAHEDDDGLFDTRPQIKVVTENADAIMAQYKAGTPLEKLFCQMREGRTVAQFLCLVSKDDEIYQDIVYLALKYGRVDIAENAIINGFPSYSGAVLDMVSQMDEGVRLRIFQALSSRKDMPEQFADYLPRSMRPREAVRVFHPVTHQQMSLSTDAAPAKSSRDNIPLIDKGTGIGTKASVLARCSESRSAFCTPSTSNMPFRDVGVPSSNRQSSRAVKPESDSSLYSHMEREIERERQNAYLDDAMGYY
jgi:hypothetical protein